MSSEAEESSGPPTEGFGELIRYTLPGYAGGLVLGATLDHFGLQRSGLGQAFVRTLAGEGESLLEGLYALRRRIGRGRASMAEAYAWGKLIGVAFPWLVDAVSRYLGVDVYGVEGFYIPFFYGLGDQIGGNVSGLLFLRRRTASWSQAFGTYLRHPVMLTGLIVILAVPCGLAIARVLGFSPSTQVLTALETILANLCWLPPLVGWMAERRSRNSNG